MVVVAVAATAAAVVLVCWSFTLETRYGLFSEQF